MKDPAKIVAEALAVAAPDRREAILCALLAHAAAGLTVVVGAEKAAEQVYRLADAVVTRSVRARRE